MAVIVAIKDETLSNYSAMHIVPSEAHAVRAFTDQVNQANEQNQLYLHPGDFSLWKLGTVDEMIGKVDDNDEGTPVRLITGKQAQRPLDA